VPHACPRGPTTGRSHGGRGRKLDPRGGFEEAASRRGRVAMEEHTTRIAEDSRRLLVAGGGGGRR
jgi:hypothetical protein